VLPHHPHASIAGGGSLPHSSIVPTALICDRLLSPGCLRTARAGCLPVWRGRTASATSAGRRHPGGTPQLGYLSPAQRGYPGCVRPHQGLSPIDSPGVHSQGTRAGCSSPSFSSSPPRLVCLGDGNPNADLSVSRPWCRPSLARVQAVVNAFVGQLSASEEHLKQAQHFFNMVGSSPSECDTIPGRQAMASCLFLMKHFDEVLVYLRSIKTFYFNDDTFNYNYGIALAGRPHGSGSGGSPREAMRSSPDKECTLRTASSSCQY